MSERAPVVELVGVSAGYGREDVLEKVDLAIGPEEMLAVIGPNGGGKTTLLKVILGLMKPREGRVVRRLSDRPGAMGYVPQFASFERDLPFRVIDVVLMGRLGLRGIGARYTTEDREASRRALHRFGLGRQADLPIGELSGGQIQRVLIARALAGEPEILFLDEPLASIDAEFRRTLLDTVSELRHRIPVVVVTHDLTPFGGRFDHIACVNRTLYDHDKGELSREDLEEVYGCPVEIVTHGVPHRVLDRH